MSMITSNAARPSPEQVSSWSDWHDTGGEEEVFETLTADQARQWRERHPPLSLKRMLMLQLLAGVLVTIAAGLWSGQARVAWSAAYGAMAVLLPAALAARGMARWAVPGATPGAALTGLLLWEMIKLLLTVVLLLAAPGVLGNPSWLALLAGMVVVLKIYWVALWWRPGVRRVD